jgi:hypothetical protein
MQCHIFSQYSPSIVVILTKSVPLEGMYSHTKSIPMIVLGLGQCSTTYVFRWEKVTKGSIRQGKFVHR